WVPGTVPAGPVAAAVRAAWPGAACTIDEVTAPIPGSAAETRPGRGALAPALPAWDPLNADHHTDPMRPLVGAGCGLPATAPSPGSAAETRAVGGALAPALPAWYPRNVAHDTDPMRPLVEAGAGLHATEYACVQVLARPATPRQVARLRKGAAALRTGKP